MSKEKYIQIIGELTDRIEKDGDDWHLFFNRGFFYYLMEDEVNAKKDYNRAVQLGLEPTEQPYYSFSPSNELRRNFILPEKILVVLVLIIVCFALTMQVMSFIMQFKGVS